MRKALRELLAHIRAHGLVRGLRLVWLKSRKASRDASIFSAVTGGLVWVRPGTSDLAIYDQIVLHPYLPTNRSFTTIVDCGANIGLTVRYLKAAYPHARIIAIEPDDGNFAMLQRNTAGLPGIVCLKAGVWPTSGFLNLRQEGLGSSGFQTVAGDEGSNLPAMSIPDIMKHTGIDRISLLKIDIEGSELELFSAADVSWIERVDAISIEIHDRWRPGCGDAFFKAITSWSWAYSVHGETLLCEKQES